MDAKQKLKEWMRVHGIGDFALGELRKITTDPIREIGYRLAINALGIAETTHKQSWKDQERRERRK